MELIRIQDPTHPLAEPAWRIYEQSFPLCEQRPAAEHIRALSNPAFHYNLLLDEGRLIGLLSWWEWTSATGTNFRFGEHFAIDPANIYCVGDHDNDLSMLRLAREGFVPANAAPAVLAAGFTQVCHCEEGAVGQVIALLDQRY